MAPEDITLATVPSVNHHFIRLTYRQWIHISESHDYMVGNREKVLDTISDPDRLVAGIYGETIALKHYAKTNITEKICIAIYRDEPDGFIITAFLTSRPDKIVKKGNTLWMRPSSI